MSNMEVKKPILSRYFQVILYPDDPFHVTMFTYISQIFDHCYILHDKDIWTDSDIEEWRESHPDDVCPYVVGELKKAHYHLIYYRVNPTTAESQTKFFRRWYKMKVDAVSDVHSACLYLLHRTPDSFDKYQYPVDSLSCTNKFKKFFDSWVVGMRKTIILRNLAYRAQVQYHVVSTSQLLAICENQDEIDLVMEYGAFFQSIIRESHWLCQNQKKYRVQADEDFNKLFNVIFDDELEKIF